MDKNSKKELRKAISIWQKSLDQIPSMFENEQPIFYLNRIKSFLEEEGLCRKSVISLMEVFLVNVVIFDGKAVYLHYEDANTSAELMGVSIEEYVNIGENGE